MSLLDPALQEFILGTDDLLEHLAFFERAAALRPRLNNYLNWQQIDGDGQNLSRSFMKARVDGSIILQGLLLRLTAISEAFIRRIIRDAIKSINRRKMGFEKVGDTLRQRNRLSVGRALTTVAEPQAHHQLDFDSLCAEVGTCVPKAQVVILSADAFSFAAKGSGPQLIEAAFSLLGNDLSWDAIAKDEAIKPFFRDSGTRSTAKAVQDRLSELQKMRNAYSHTGAPGPQLSSAELKSFCDFLRALMPLLKTVMEGNVEILVAGN